MLQVLNGIIVDKQKKPFTLKGINTGGWLMMEGYILGGRNIPEHVFKGWIAKRYGRKTVKEFTAKFRANWFNSSDIDNIKKLGFNCVRLPFNYRLLKEKGGLNYLKRVVKEFAKRRMYVILDMHSAPGSQNKDWHSDSDGRARLWEDKKNRGEFTRLWRMLSKAFKNEEWVAGYDIMNEPVTGKPALLKDLFQEAINAIRKERDGHIIFLEGNNWGCDFDFIREIKGSNIVLSFHFYQPVQYTFNWLPGQQYPGVILGKKWDRKEIRKSVKYYSDMGKALGMPVHCGEFGVASRCNLCGTEYKWVNDILSVFKELGVHWTYWTYKSVKGMKLPDGLFQLTDTSGLIGDPTVGEGMDRFIDVLKDRGADLFKLFYTGNYKLNRLLYRSMRSFL